MAETDRTTQGLDLEALRAWLDQEGIGAGDLSRLRRIGGGTQNVMVTFTRAGQEYVLRRGPVSLREWSNDTMRKEIRILEALRHTDIPHPRLVAACLDDNVMADAVFYLMEPVDGFNPVSELPETHRRDATVRHDMALNTVAAFAQLRELDYQSLGLGDMGRPDDFLQRQPQRWAREWNQYQARLTQLGERADETVSDIAEWLARNIPAQSKPGLMHGDFHLGNVMFSRQTPAVAAIVDWELATIADPLLDLAWLAVTWPDPGGREDIPGTKLAELGDLPDRSKLVAHYEDITGSQLTDFDWYFVLAAFKLGVLLHGTYVRSIAGEAPKDVGLRLERLSGILLRRARERL